MPIGPCEARDRQAKRGRAGARRELEEEDTAARHGIGIAGGV
jgi:hypothetical protein